MSCLLSVTHARIISLCKPGGHHEHPDCVRMAAHYLDAQKPTKYIPRRSIPLRHMVSAWAGRYISTDDLDVAARMLCGMRGEYPNYAFTRSPIWPDVARLEGIGQAGMHPNLYCNYYLRWYRGSEKGAMPITDPRSDEQLFTLHSTGDRQASSGPSPHEGAPQ